MERVRDALRQSSCDHRVSITAKSCSTGRALCRGCREHMNASCRLSMHAHAYAKQTRNRRTHGVRTSKLQLTLQIRPDKTQVRPIASKRTWSGAALAEPCFWLVGLGRVPWAVQMDLRMCDSIYTVRTGCGQQRIGVIVEKYTS
jgi:hypothetical protein